MNRKKFIFHIFLAIATSALPFILSSCTTLDHNASATKNPKTQKVRGSRVNQMVLSQSSRANTRVVVDVADQKAFLLVDGKIGAVSPISTARPGKYTPRGSFTITEKVRSGKISTIYDVSMPYWMRLGGTPFGLHAGYLPGYPASAGCIRMPSNMAKVFYDNLRPGTRVNILSRWNGE